MICLGLLNILKVDLEDREEPQDVEYSGPRWTNWRLFWLKSFSNTSTSWRGDDQTKRPSLHKTGHLTTSWTCFLAKILIGKYRSCSLFVHQNALSWLYMWRQIDDQLCLPGKDTCLWRFITQYLVSEKFRYVVENYFGNYF